MRMHPAMQLNWLHMPIQSLATLSCIHGTVADVGIRPGRDCACMCKGHVHATGLQGARTRLRSLPSTTTSICMSII